MKPIMQRPSISATLIIVVTKLKLAPVLKLLEFRTVRRTIIIIAVKSGARGIRFAAYVPRAMAAIAIGAAKPIVIEIKPDRKPSAGW